jgi:single-strand DNA-binding protein
MFNQITLLGNLTRDIELRYTQGGAGIASAGLATSHKYTSNGEKKEETLFVDITFFGKSAEIANQYLRKGSKVLIVGRLKLDQWVDQNGQKRSKHGVIVETMKMLDSKGENQSQGQGGQGQQGGNQNQGYQQPQPQYQDNQGNAQNQQQYQQNQNQYNAKN